MYQESTIKSGGHEAKLSTRVLQGVALAAFLTLFRVIVGAASRNDTSIGEIAILFGAVSCGGAAGGATYYATDRLRVAGGWRKTVANVCSLLAYCFATMVVIAFLWWLTHGGRFE